LLDIKKNKFNLQRNKCLHTNLSNCETSSRLFPIH